MNEIATRIYNLMQEKSMSYGELAKITGIPKSALQRYASGSTPKIPLDRLKLIAQGLDVSAAYLMGWAEEEPLSAKKQRLVDAIEKMTDEQAASLLMFVQSLIGKQE